MTDSKFWRTCPSCQRLLQAKLFKHSATCIDCSLGNSAQEEAVTHLPVAVPGADTPFSQRVLKLLQLKRDTTRTDLQAPDLHWRLVDLYMMAGGEVLCSPTEQSISYSGTKVKLVDGQLQLLVSDSTDIKVSVLESAINRLNSLYWNSIKTRGPSTIQL